MRIRSKFGLIGALAAISVPTIITAVSCGQSERYSISVSDNRVVLSKYKVTKGKQVNLKLKTVDSDQCQLNNVTDVKVGGSSIAGKYYFGHETEGSEWTHYLIIQEEVVIDGPIEIEAEVAVNEFKVSVVNEEVDFVVNSTQCYHDTTILLGTRSGFDVSIKGVKNVTINRERLDPKYYEFSTYIGSKQYKHSLRIKEDPEHPHIVSGDISIELDVPNTFCNITCSENVVVSKEKTIQGQALAVMLRASSLYKVIDSVQAVTIGEQPVEIDKIELKSAPAAEIQFTHELIIKDASLITGNIFISMNVKDADLFSITINNPNVGSSSSIALKNTTLHLFMWPKLAYKMSLNPQVWIGSTLLTKDDFTFDEYHGEGYPEGTRELVIDAEKITDNINIHIGTEKVYSILSLDKMPEGIDATLSQTTLHYGTSKGKTIDVSITRPKDWKFLNGGNIKFIMGSKTYTDKAKITPKDTPGEYTISFIGTAISIDNDIVFCIGEEIEINKINYDQEIFVGKEDITKTGRCTVDASTLTEGFLHNDRVEADITTNTTYSYDNFLFNGFEITLVSEKGEAYPLKKDEDYNITIDPDDTKSAHVVIFENAIDEPSSWDSKINKIIFKYVMLDTVEKHSFIVTDGITTNTYPMADKEVFLHPFDQDLVDKTKDIKKIIVWRKEESGNWHKLDEGQYVFDLDIFEIGSAETTNDIKVKLELQAQEGITFENDDWENLAYWANAGDADLLAKIYNLGSKEQLLNKRRSVTYDGIEQEVRVIGIEHDYLKCAEEGDMGELESRPAALTFEFVDLLQDSSGPVKLDIGKSDTNGQNYWRYNEGLESKGTWGHQSNIRTFLKDKFASKFDPEVAPWVKTISKRRLAYAEVDGRFEPEVETKFMIFNDQYFIPTVTELNGTQGDEGTLAKKTYVREGIAYEEYAKEGEPTDYAWEKRAKKVNGKYKEYWTSSFSIRYQIAFQIFYDDAMYIYGGSEGYGNPMSQTIDYDMCIAPCFCI